MLWELPQGPQRSSPLASQQPMTFARGTQNWRDISHGDLAQTVGLQEEKASNRRGRRFGEQQHHHEQQPIHNPHQWEPAREGRALAEEARVFPGGLELECDLEVPGSGVLAGGPTIIEPAEVGVFMLILIKLTRLLSHLRCGAVILADCDVRVSHPFPEGWQRHVVSSS